MISHPINTSKLWLALGAYVESDAKTAVYASVDRGRILKPVSPADWDVVFAGKTYAYLSGFIHYTPLQATICQRAVMASA
jgi:hypothetical protein